MADNYCEYIIKEKAEGQALTKKILFISAYILFALTVFALVFIFSPPDLFIPLNILALSLSLLLVFLTWRFACREYEIIIREGELSVTLIYGKSYRKLLLCTEINSISEFGEYDDNAYNEISKLSLQKDYVCLSSLSAPCVYYALFDEDDEHCILYFDATREAIALIKKHNLSALLASKRRMGER